MAKELLPSLQLAYDNGYSIRARVQDKEGERHVVVGWWKPEGKPAAQEIWLPIAEGSAIFSMLAAYCKDCEALDK